jgi:hypothetical protein
MGLITPIYIKPDKYFYNYYQDYIKKKNNSESDYFILNLLKCKSKLITPIFITKNNQQDYRDCKILAQKSKLALSQEYYENFKSKVIQNKHICNICYENVGNDVNYVVTQCLHTYCIKCTNTLYFNNNNVSLKETDSHSSFKKRNNNSCKRYFKCPICSHKQNQDQLFLLTNDKKHNDIRNNYLSIIQLIYNTVCSEKKDKFTYNINKNFIYKYIGYKTYYILKNIVDNTYPFNINENTEHSIYNITKYTSKNKKSTTHIKIILSNNPKWIELMNVIIPNNHIHFCLIGNMPQYINDLVNVLIDTINNKSDDNDNDYVHFHLYLVEPYAKTKYDAIKSNLNNLILNISSNTDDKYKNIQLSPYQLVIKNTIDEKIFKNKVIIT